MGECLETQSTGRPTTQDARLIRTDNPDLGIALGTEHNLNNVSTWVTPNTDSVPLKLDGTGAAGLTLYAAPVRVGAQPQAGVFSGVAVLKLSIP